MEYLDTILGAGIAWLAYRTGVRREQQRRPKEKKAICGCKHSRSFHVDGAGRCNHTNWDNVKDCGCQHYVGPVTYNDVIDEELT